LELNGLTRKFGEHLAVDGLTLSVGRGELVALIGASGSGKTTTLRMAAGYEPADAGRVVLEGRDITTAPPQKRDFGMVFQHYALFPHMSVQDNVAFGLEARGIARRERRDSAREALAVVGLAHTAERPVQSLSGGEQQRVALARAVVIKPRVLLLDEPLSNLDPTLRRSMRDELRTMLRKLNVTALLVTHDQEDAFAVADRVALMKSGRLLQTGTPEELYDRPLSKDVAAFIGKSALVPARVEGDKATITIDGLSQSVSCGQPVEGGQGGGRRGGEWLAVLRPESLGFASSGWRGTVVWTRFAGAAFVYHVALAGGPEVEVTTRTRRANEGDNVSVAIATDRIAVVPA
jgi:ABC-type Fe3+/spermidine/putrescine transport system ATPase subunit